MPFFKKSKSNLEVEYPLQDSAGAYSEFDSETALQSPSQNGTEKPKMKKVSVKEDTKGYQENSTTEIQEQGEDWVAPEGELAVDVYQTTDEVVIRAPIAGVRAEDLDVVIEEDMVTITGERKNPAKAETSELEYFTQEAYWGPFSRQILLPEPVDLNKVEASMKYGIFTLRLPKTGETIKVKKVKVKG